MVCFFGGLDTKLEDCCQFDSYAVVLVVFVVFVVFVVVYFLIVVGDCGDDYDD